MEEISGDREAVVRKVLEQLAERRITAEQAAEVISALASPEEGHDVTIGTRVALIAQGFEDAALALRVVRMHLAEAGAIFNYQVVRGSVWDGEPPPLLAKAMLDATVLVLRAGNIDARLDPDSPGQYILDGQITDHHVDIDEVVAEFRAEVDREFPDRPTPRRGEWW